MKSRKSLTPDEARNALYIDFEGRKGKPPVLLGCTRRSKVKSSASVWQAITDESLRPLGEADGLEVLSLVEAVERILQRAQSGNRRIVAWSNHELNVVERDCPDQLEPFRDRYLNARSLVVRWRNSRHDGAKPASNTLSAYFKFLKYPAPDDARSGRAGETIKLLQEGLANGRGVAGLTPNRRQRWQDLIAHNDHDCVGMRRIVVAAADEMARSKDDE